MLPVPSPTPPLDLATAVTVEPAAQTTLTGATRPCDGRDSTRPGEECRWHALYGAADDQPCPGILASRIAARGIAARSLSDDSTGGRHPRSACPHHLSGVDSMPPGNGRFDLWSLYPDTGTFLVVGRMRVSADGATVK